MLNKKYLIYIRRCFDLARLGNGTVSPNPSVGSIIVHNDKIIGEGWHKAYGKPHAEVNAIASIQSENLGCVTYSKIFVSLEPCFHFGKTPPCVNLILDKKIPFVGIAFKDSNPQVGGQSIVKLSENNVEVQQLDVIPPDIQAGYDYTLKPFFTTLQEKRPYIILKWAESADGFIGQHNKRRQISNELSKRLVHKWRSECDGIMVGTQTAQTDNPALDNRYYFGKSPVRIVLDKSAKLDSTLQLFDGKVKTIVYNSLSAAYTEGSYPKNSGGVIPRSQEYPETILDKHNVYIKKITFDDTLIPHILNDLLSEKINILLVEGGAQTLASFIKMGYWDEVRIIRSSKSLKDNEKPESDYITAPKIPLEYLENRYKLADNEVLFYKKH